MAQAVWVARNGVGWAILLEGAFVMIASGLVGAVGIAAMGFCVALSAFVVMGAELRWKLIPFFSAFIVLLMWRDGTLANLSRIAEFFLLPFRGWLIGW